MLQAGAATGQVIDAAFGVAPMSALQEVVIVGGVPFQAQMRELGDYKLYAVPEPTTIAARQSKQVSFLSQSRVPFTRLYMFKVDENSIRNHNNFEPQHAIRLLRLQNKESDGLGLKNIDDRIKTLYESAECGVKIENLDTGALVTIQMPAKWR